MLFPNVDRKAVLSYWTVVLLSSQLRSPERGMMFVRRAAAHASFHVCVCAVMFWLSVGDPRVQFPVLHLAAGGGGGCREDQFNICGEILLILQAVSPPAGAQKRGGGVVFVSLDN